MNLAEVRKTTKPCPSCAMAIAKDGSCSRGPHIHTTLYNYFIRDFLYKIYRVASE
jgi:hypothetical protein